MTLASPGVSDWYPGDAVAVPGNGLVVRRFVAVSLSFTRFDAMGLDSLTPLLRGRGGGIYVLEFADGSQYVGQAVNFVTRMTTHRRGGGRHHEAWRDVVAVSVMNVPLDQLDRWERHEIEQRRATGIRLRNRVFNFGFLGPSALDHVIPVDQQAHWATGGGDFGLDQYVEASRRTPGPTPSLFQSSEAMRRRELTDGWSPTRAELVVRSLSLLIPQVIPNAPQLEGDFWSLSDNPDTGGGRFATLNVGGLELAYFPRSSEFEDDQCGPVDTIVFNLPAGTVLHEQSSEGKPLETEEFFNEAQFPDGSPCWAARAHYGITDTDLVAAPIQDLLNEVWGITGTMRAFAIDLMRAGNSRKFARWHSSELARRIYEQVTEQ
jgi:hypothetical protein